MQRFPFNRNTRDDRTTGERDARPRGNPNTRPHLNLDNPPQRYAHMDPHPHVDENLNRHVSISAIKHTHDYAYPNDYPKPHPGGAAFQGEHPRTVPVRSGEGLSLQARPGGGR